MAYTVGIVRAFKGEIMGIEVKDMEVFHLAVNILELVREELGIDIDKELAKTLLIEIQEMQNAYGDLPEAGYEILDAIKFSCENVKEVMEDFGDNYSENFEDFGDAISERLFNTRKRE